jgi:hypothetical protein
MRMLGIALAVWLTVGAAQPAAACKPPSWAYGPGASSPAVYADTLLAQASTVIYGRVRKVQLVGEWEKRNGFVEIELIENFKGPIPQDGIYTVRVGLCPGGPYEVDMRRLFVLQEVGERKGRFFEYHAWQWPKHPEELLMVQLHALKNARQPN